ncbi:MAG: DUF4157 domain-containing protein [Deltaproteobacteria bacterium]|nr:MAG: DUF4157 domain-containing protein [Deltaproteobacteria bacterium]
MAGEIGARAHTVGRDMVFGKGYYAPEKAAGCRLLAHKFTLVVQRTGARGSASDSL